MKACNHCDESKPTRVRYRAVPQPPIVMKVWLRLAKWQAPHSPAPTPTRGRRKRALHKVMECPKKSGQH